MLCSLFLLTVLLYAWSQQIHKCLEQIVALHTYLRYYRKLVLTETFQCLPTLVFIVIFIVCITFTRCVLHI